MEVGLIACDIFEEGAEGTRDESLDRLCLHALFMQARTDAQRAFVLDRLEYFLLGFEVVVERAGGERSGADDVAHRRGAVTQLGEHPARRLKDDMAVLFLCDLPLALGLGVRARDRLDVLLFHPSQSSYS